MTIQAQIVADSISSAGVRLTTFVLKYPRFIHAEFMTHRDFSRNASSSRAIPIERQIKDIQQDVAMPVDFRRNKKGMQAGDAYGPFGQWVCRGLWRTAAFLAILMARLFLLMGVHKQYANRLLEPFAHITVIVSATRYANFFALRHHSMAQPEIAVLARLMWAAYEFHTPSHLRPGDWHLPFVTPNDYYEAYAEFGTTMIHSKMNPELLEALVKRSVARCARVSYLNHDGTRTSLEQDFALYDRLLAEQPIHASPAEHQACAEITAGIRSGNFHGWIQYRKTLRGECVVEFKQPLG